MTTLETLMLPGFEQTELELMQSAEDSHARTLAKREKWQELKAKNLASGASTLALLANYDHKSSSWRTSQHCLVEGFTEFSETWPRSGMMQNGIAYQLPTLVPLTKETGSGLLPTPSGTSNHGQNHVSGRLDEWGGNSNPWRGTDIGKLHCPRFEEWMMGYPDRWTEPMLCETQSSRS